MHIVSKKINGICKFWTLPNFASLSVTINRTAVRRMVRTAVRTRKRMTQKRGRKRTPMKRRKCACQAWMEKKRLASHMTSKMWFNVGNMGDIGGGCLAFHSGVADGQAGHIK